MQQLIISGSPHIHTSDSVSRRMWNVVIALLPAVIAGVWVFGLKSLSCLAVSVGACLLCEWVIATLIMKRPFTLSNGSALITGILLAMNVPDSLPWWMVTIGAIVAIGIGKMSFGGLGANIWNPALVGRVFLLLSFPAAMTTWSTSVGSGIAGADASSGATILSTLKMSGHHIDSSAIDWLGVTLGNMNGSWGEVSAIALLIGLVYMLITKTITWHIPVSMLASAALLAWIAGANPLVELLTGGMILGAVFMATDYVTSPMTHRGQIIYGVLIGLITMVIRIWGAYPEGVSFAILLGNSCTPLLNKYCRPQRFGTGRTAKARKEAAA
ncbi:MAG: RnfABCDGE type electron transport complex subunit D [Prevotella sp.]|nr:RnfABCDGE type electron transport complex subunit D [Prevotella sp.]MCM1074106.1 RnfABCDGE type electron transport complex subunit D [Ruminococcus sp.]